MMYIYVYSEQIAGYTNDPSQTPSGFEVYEHPDQRSLDELYFDTIARAIKQKPVKPSDSAYWDNHKACWVEPKPIVVESEENLTETDEYKACMRLIKDNPDLMLNLVMALYTDAKGHPDRKKFRNVLKQRVETTQKQQAKTSQSSPQTTTTTTTTSINSGLK